MSTITFSNTDFSRPDFGTPQFAVRLTRRGKAVVVTAALVVIALLAIAFSSAAVSTSDSGQAQETRSVRVVAGQTLWTIAAEANPHGDIRETVDEILQLNSLPSASALQLGSEIAVPVY